MLLTTADCERIANAIRAAEKTTCGEIVCVLMRRSSDYAATPPLWAAFLALIAPWPLLMFTDLATREIFAAQIGVFVVAVLLISWAPLRFLLTPRLVKRARARRAAIEQFYSRGVSATRDRAGVLIFVSVAERYARIVADDGLATKITDDDWRRALDLLLANIREERIAEGFVAAVENCGRLLAAHAPPHPQSDDLPDKIYVL